MEVKKKGLRMIDRNQLPIPAEAIEAAAEVLYEAWPISFQNTHGYYKDWDELMEYQKTRYRVMARRALRTAEAVRLELAA